MGRTKVIKTLVVLVLVFVANSMSAQVQLQKIEASFIANFMRYIQWPEQESLKSFTIGVYGKNHAIFSALNNTVNGKNVGLARISVVEVETADDMKGCQIVFIPSGRSLRAKKLVGALDTHSVMTITEEQDYMPKYAMVNFKVRNNKLTFQLNQEIASQKQIQVSSKLAQMASN
ncbi:MULTISPECIES: YfiR family protein [unclassified Saccharicrinis]|uniref:YfiR family protein n=1 Tax=unclassified Saccharicrinis TaxID=2646859 RepID=UPI003D34BC2A